MSLKYTTVFVVVVFLRRVQRNQRCMEMVPRDWIQYFSTEQTWKCLYPAPKEYEILERMIKDIDGPKPYWKFYGCRIIKEAGTYNINIQFKH